VIKKTVVFAIPGDLSTATGGYGYDRKIMQGLRELGWTVVHIELGDGFPWPSDATLKSGLSRFSGLAYGCPIVIDGLAFGVMPQEVSLLSIKHPLIALVHHPLALETGLSEPQRKHLRESEQQALHFARQVIVTSSATALLMSDYGVADRDVTAILPGTEVSKKAVKLRTQSSMQHSNNRVKPDEPLKLLSVGTLTPRKGFDVLVRALAQVKDLNWTLTIVGDEKRDADCASRIKNDISHFGLHNRIKLSGTLTEDELATYYVESDIFVLASKFEGYGMAYAEAMAYGLPVIGSNAGAIASTVPPEAGLLVPPDNVDELASAIRLMVPDLDIRVRLSEGARRASLRQPTWLASAQEFERVLLTCLV
jgi:glycosyltransferase involved in cell wall biosynthesis